MEPSEELGGILELESLVINTENEELVDYSPRFMSYSQDAETTADSVLNQIEDKMEEIEKIEELSSQAETPDIADEKIKSFEDIVTMNTNTKQVHFDESEISATSSTNSVYEDAECRSPPDQKQSKLYPGTPHPKTSGDLPVKRTQFDLMEIPKKRVSLDLRSSRKRKSDSYASPTRASKKPRTRSASRAAGSPNKSPKKYTRKGKIVKRKSGSNYRRKSYGKK